MHEHLPTRPPRRHWISIHDVLLPFDRPGDIAHGLRFVSSTTLGLSPQMPRYLVVGYPSFLVLSHLQVRFNLYRRSKTSILRSLVDVAEQVWTLRGRATSIDVAHKILDCGHALETKYVVRRVLSP